jgi:hypothetical protein
LPLNLIFCPFVGFCVLYQWVIHTMVTLTGKAYPH